MTNDDELLKRLDESLYFLKRTDGGHRADVAIECIEDAAARIRELKARLADKHYKSLFMTNSDGSVSQVSCERCADLDAGTHVIVPVEPTEQMLSVGSDTYVDAGCAPDVAIDFAQMSEIYRAMIRAAQEGDDG